MTPLGRDKCIDAKVGRQQGGELALEAVDVDLRQVVDAAVKIYQVLGVILHVLVDVVERGEICEEGVIEQRALRANLERRDRLRRVVGRNDGGRGARIAAAGLVAGRDTAVEQVVGVDLLIDPGLPRQLG